MQKDYNLDDILNEYSKAEEKPKVQSKPMSKKEPFQHTGHISISEAVKSADATLLSDREKSENNEARKKPSPSHQSGKFAVSDVSRPNVSYINSVKEVQINKADLPPRPTDSIDGYEGAVTVSQPSDESYVPKVRKMSNSTRAKEMRSKRRKKKKNQPDFTYAVESPDGIYTKPESKKTKFVVSHEEKVKKENPKTDMVELSESVDPMALDVKIPEQHYKTALGEKQLRSKRKKSENKAYDKKQSIKDYDSFENAREIKNDIADLKGNISFRISILIIMTLFSCYMATGEFLKLPVPEMLSSTHSPKVYCIIQLLILLLSAIVSFGTVKNGILSLLKFRADSDSLAAMTFLATGAAAVSAVMNPDMVGDERVYIYTPVAVISLLINAIGKRMILNRASLNFDFISKDFDRNAIVCVDDVDRAESMTRGTIGDFPILAAMKPASFIKDFGKYTYSADTGDKYSRIIAPVSALLSALIAAAVTAFRMGIEFTAENICFALFVFSACVSVCSCVAIPLVANIPLEKAAKKYVRNHGAMLGYQSVEDYFDINSVMIDASTLFPTGTINLCSIKLFSGTKIDDALIEAASLASHGNSILKELFNDVIAGKQKMLSRVENFVYEDSMGLCGWINNRRILLGNRELMNSHKIEGIPTKTKESEFTDGNRDALYLSVSGNLAAMFIIEITSSPAVKKAMKQLENNDMAVIIKSVDPFITISRISALFNFTEDLLKIIPQRMVKDFDEETKRETKISASMVCSGKFTSFVQLIMGTKSIKKTVWIGVALQCASVLLGIGLVALNCLLNAYSDISPAMIIGYHLICTVLTFFIAKIRKT